MPLSVASSNGLTKTLATQSLCRKRRAEDNYSLLDRDWIRRNLEAALARLFQRSLFLFLRSLDLVEVIHRVVADGDNLIIARKPRFPGGFRARPEEDHVFVAGVVELIQLSRRDGHEHAGRQLARASVREVKCAFASDTVKLLIGAVLVHRAFRSR